MEEEDNYILLKEGEEITSNTVSTPKYNQNDLQNTPVEVVFDTMSEYKVMKMIYFLILLHPIMKCILKPKVFQKIFNDNECAMIDRCGLGILVIILVAIQLFSPDKTSMFLLTFLTILFLFMHILLSSNKTEILGQFNVIIKRLKNTKK